MEGLWLVYSPTLANCTILLHTMTAACACILCQIWFVVVSGVDGFQAPASHIYTCVTLLMSRERQHHNTTSLQNKSNFSSLLTDEGWARSCGSFPCLLVSLLLLPIQLIAHNTAPALQTRMDDFTVLPGFPLWPRDLPLPSADISQQQRRTQLSGSLHSRITVQRARSDTRTRHPHLNKGSNSQHRIYSGAQHDSFVLNPASIPRTVGNHVWGAAIQRGENERLRDGQRGQPDVL